MERRCFYDFSGSRKENPAVLFFHAMGVTGESSRPVAASSLGTDLACAFLAETKLSVHHVFFDGGQFARIDKATRHIMVPFLSE